MCSSKEANHAQKTKLFKDKSMTYQLVDDAVLYISTRKQYKDECTMNEKRSIQHKAVKLFMARH